MWESYQQQIPGKRVRDADCRRRQATWITGPTGVTVGIDTDYETFLLVDDLPGCTKPITVYAVDSVEKYCSLPAGGTD